MLKNFIKTFLTCCNQQTTLLYQNNCVILLKMLAGRAELSCCLHRFLEALLYIWMWSLTGFEGDPGGHLIIVPY